MDLILLASLHLCVIKSLYFAMISILMPVFNTAPYLRICLDSICRQTFGDWELIAVDDHSTDNSRHILESYARLDPRIHWYPNQGKGIIPALRKAYHKSKGHMIHRMDSDDVMPRDKLENLYEILISDGPGVVATGQVDYFSTEKVIQRGFLDYADWINTHIARDAIFEEIYTECPIASPAWLMYRDDLESIGGVVGDFYPEDYDLVFRMFIRDLVPRGCTKVVHYWRDWSDRASRTWEEYADQLFFDLKLHYFLTHSYQRDKPLVLWGAGKKGKKLFRKIQETDTETTWVTDNPRKIGRDIYHTVLQDPSEGISSDSQVIVAVSDPIAKSNIQHRLELLDW